MDFFFIFCVCLCYSVLSVSRSLVVICLERVDFLALLFVNMFSCVFITFPYGILGQVWYLNVSIPDICLLPYFNRFMSAKRTFSFKMFYLGLI